MAASGTVQLHRPNHASSDDLQRCGRATFAYTPLDTDPGGSRDSGRHRRQQFPGNLGRYVERNIRLSKQLVLDLRAVEFVGSQTFTALYYVSVACARADVDWIITGSHHVRRLLSICDPDRELPFVNDLVSGLARLDRLAQCRYNSDSSGLIRTIDSDLFNRPHRTQDGQRSRGGTPPSQRATGRQHR